MPPPPWIRACSKLDFSIDRGESYRAWRVRWDDYALLSGLSSQTPALRIAVLRSCLSDDAIKVVSNFDLAAEKRDDLKSVLKCLEDYACGQTNRVFQRRLFNLRPAMCAKSLGRMSLRAVYRPGHVAAAAVPAKMAAPATALPAGGKMVAAVRPPSVANVDAPTGGRTGARRAAGNASDVECWITSFQCDDLNFGRTIAPSRLCRPSRSPPPLSRPRPVFW